MIYSSHRSITYIFFAFLSFPLRGMEPSISLRKIGSSEESESAVSSENDELLTVKHLVDSARHYKPIVKNFPEGTYISAIYPPQKHTIAVIASDSRKATYSTLHIYNALKNQWFEQIIDSDQRTLAEYGFNIESINNNHQKKLIGLLKKLHVWQSTVQPVTTIKGNMVFVDDGTNTIEIINPKKAEKVGSFTIPLTNPPFTWIKLFPTNSERITLSTDTIDTGTVYIFSPEGKLIFSETERDDKPQEVISCSSTVTLIARNNKIDIWDHSFDPIKKTIKGNLVNYYDNKALISCRDTHDYRHPYRLETYTIEDMFENKTHTSKECEYPSYSALNRGHNFFIVPSNSGCHKKECLVSVMSPYLKSVQKIESVKGIQYNHQENNHAVVYPDRVPLVHGQVTKKVLSPKGRTMFKVEDGLFIFFRPRKITFLTPPQTVDEFHFLASQDTAKYCLYKHLHEKSFSAFSEGKLPTTPRNENCLSLDQVAQYHKIPERLRKDLEQKVKIISPLDLHCARLSPEEFEFLTKIKKYKANNDKYMHLWKARPFFLFQEIVEAMAENASMYPVASIDLESYNAIPESLQKELEKKIDINHYKLQATTGYNRRAFSGRDNCIIS
jgi:hypothetical protein